MGTTYTIGNKTIDVDDADAIRALNDDELKTLLEQTLRSPGAAGDQGPVLRQDQPPEGTGIVLPGSTRA
jgi:hypothetical protein